MSLWAITKEIHYRYYFISLRIKHPTDSWFGKSLGKISAEEKDVIFLKTECDSHIMNNKLRLDIFNNYGIILTALL
jgi:hypothetical protein